MSTDQTKGKPKYLAPGVCPRCGSTSLSEDGCPKDTGEAVGYHMRCADCGQEHIQWHTVTYTPTCITVDGEDFEFPSGSQVESAGKDDGQHTCPRSMTDEQRSKYLATGGCRCPYCQSYDTQGDSFDYEGDQVSQRVLCLNPQCGRSWIDVYKLTDVLDDD